MNLCRSCGKDFGSVSAFDAHRVGKHQLDWPEHENGRRCLDDEEMENGWHQDKAGRWRENLRSDAFVRFAHSHRRAGKV